VQGSDVREHDIAGLDEFCEPGWIAAPAWPEEENPTNTDIAIAVSKVSTFI
jgi:hypothetical protein